MRRLADRGAWPRLALVVTVAAAGCAERSKPRPAGAEAPPTPGPAPAGEAAPAAPAPQPSAGLREVFPHVRVDAGARVVEFDARVEWEFHDPQTPLTYLEVVVCTPNTKEHESLLVTRAKPSEVHAALLLIGLEPGVPGRFVQEGDLIRGVDPTGPPVEVTFVVQGSGGAATTADPRDWIVNEKTGERFAPPAPDGKRPTWVFAGSRVATLDIGQGPREYYVGDLDSGTLIGLATFGTETVGWSTTMSPDSGIETPQWIAKNAAVPAMGTDVVVRIRPMSR